MPNRLRFDADDVRWQTLVHGAPVHVRLSATLPRTELPLFLALIKSWSEGLRLADRDQVHLVVQDPDATIAVDTVVTAVGPGVRVEVRAPEVSHA